MRAKNDIISANKIVARFAPSPSGISHAGNLFSYLLTWLIAKSYNGEVVLRIDDLDSSRSKSKYVDSFLNMLEECGLTYDRGPYFQSRNTQLYAKAFDTLKDMELIYPCFCTRRDLSFQSAPHESDGFRVYDGRCRHLSSDQIAVKASKLASLGRSPAYRLMTDSRRIDFDDAIQGKQSFELDSDCGDFVIRRSDSDFAYNLATVIDDIEEGINFVSRGYDLLTTTPQQIYLYELLGAKAPTYAHFPLLCSYDGRRLAKRDKSATYDSMKASYGSPERVIGHIAYLVGLQAKDQGIRPGDLLDNFDFANVAQNYKGLSSITFDCC